VQLQQTSYYKIGEKKLAEEILTPFKIPALNLLIRPVIEEL